MQSVRNHSDEIIKAQLGIGFYSVAEASRLLKTSPININRWLGGYAFGSNGQKTLMPALWTPQLPRNERHIELGFRDLIELRFVIAFRSAGLNIKTIRHCLEYARECVGDEWPFSTRRFQTDGRTLFLESMQKSGESELLDLKVKQYTLKTVIAQSFKDLDIEDNIVSRWRPYKGKDSIVIDPERSYGQPIASESGIPTITLAQAVVAEGSIARVSYLYEIPEKQVADAINFEKELFAA